MFNFNLDGTAKKVVMGALAVVAVAAIGLIVVYKDKENEQEIQNKIEEEIADRCDEIDTKLLNNEMTSEEATDAKQKAMAEVKFKYDKKAQRKAKLLNGIIKVGLWANDHKEACSGIIALLGMATAAVSLVNGIREFGKKSKILKQLDRIETQSIKHAYRAGYNDSFHTTIKCIKAALTDPQYDGIYEMVSSDNVTLLKVKVSEAA